MARKINVDLSNSIESWRNKTNLMSGYIGDLDDLTTDETLDVVASINSIESKIVSIDQARLALSLSSIGSGSYASLSYNNSTGVSTFEVSTLLQSDIPSLDAGKIATGTLALNRIPSLPTSKITSGLLADARIPGLDASKTVAGVFSIDRIPTIPQSKITGLEQLSNSVTALQLGLVETNETERTFTLAGDITGQVAFTNTGNVTLSVTVVDDLHNHTIANIDGLEGRLSTAEGLEDRLGIKGFISFNGSNGSVVNSSGLSLIKSSTGHYVITIDPTLQKGNNLYTVVLGNVDDGRTSAGMSTDNINKLSNYQTFVQSRDVTSFVIRATRNTNTILHYGGNDNNSGNAFGISLVDPTYVTAILLY